jgi:hypothetical protein
MFQIEFVKKEWYQGTKDGKWNAFHYAINKLGFKPIIQPWRQVSGPSVGRNSAVSPGTQVSILNDKSVDDVAMAISINETTYIPSDVFKPRQGGIAISRPLPPPSIPPGFGYIIPQRYDHVVVITNDDMAYTLERASSKLNVIVLALKNNLNQHLEKYVQQQIYLEDIMVQLHPPAAYDEQKSGDNEVDKINEDLNHVSVNLDSVSK